MADKSKTIELLITAKDKASSILSGVGEKFGGFAKIAKAGMVAVGTAAVAAAASITTAVVKTLSWGDDLVKTSRTLGVTTDALQGLRTAAGYAGIDVAAMDKIVLTMNRNIAEAANGAKAQSDALKSIGLSADTLKKAKPEEALAAIVDALNGMDDQAVKTQAAMDLLGRGGAKAFNLTGDAIRDATKEAKDFGFSLSSTQASDIEGLNDDISRVGIAFKGVGVILTLELLPAMREAAAAIVDLAKDGTLKEWGKAIGETIGAALSTLNEFRRIFIKTNTEKLAGLHSELQRTEEQLNAAFGENASFQWAYGVDGLKKKAEELKEKIATLEGAMKPLTAETEKQAEVTDTLAEETANFGQELFDAAKIEHEATKEKEAANKESEKQAQALEKSRQAAESLKLEIAKLASAERIKAMELTVDFKIAEVEENTKRVEAAFESINTSIQSTADVINNTISAMAGLSGGSLFDLQKFDVFKKQLEIENKLRQDTFELQKEETKAVIDAANARRKALENGDAMVKIDGAGLQPHLEAFMFEILSAIQIRVASEGGDVLLGLTEG